MGLNKKDKDEHYVLDLCDKILRLTSSRQHRFDFLRGDVNKERYCDETSC